MTLTLLQVDPSRTTLLRRRFLREISNRIRTIQTAMHKWLVTDDELGLKPRPKLKLLQRTYQFATNPAKVRAFRRWLQDQVDRGLLEVDNAGRPWASEYVESAYKKGMERAYVQANKAELAAPTDYPFAASREQFVRTAFFTAETLEKIELVSTRAWEGMKDISTSMGQQMNRILADGLANGYGPEKIARNMDNAIRKIDRTRARVIARTELIYAHAEGQLDGYKKLGIDTVTAEVEWMTAGDERVCDQCAGMEGQRYTVDEAHGLIPIHPNCRCAWRPVVKVPKRRRRK